MVYRRYLVPEHRSYVPDFGVYIKVQGANGDVEYRSLSRQLVLFCVERRKAWRMLQSKAGIENKEYKAQRSILADVDAGKISKEELFARAEELMKERVKRGTSVPVAGGPRGGARRQPVGRPAVGGSFVTVSRGGSVGMKRSASAVWSGGLKDGKGTVSTDSGVLAGVPYNFSKRFENEKGTNPEELIAAAHAACFSMALSMILGDAGMMAERIETTATVSLDQVDGGFAVTSSHLRTTVKIPNADKAAFEKAVETAKSGCPVSKLLNATITLDAKLV